MFNLYLSMFTFYCDIFLIKHSRFQNGCMILSDSERKSHNFFAFILRGLVCKTLPENLESHTRASAVKDHQFLWSISRAVEHLSEWLLCPRNTENDAVWRDKLQNWGVRKGSSLCSLLSAGKIKISPFFFLPMRVRLEKIHIWMWRTRWPCFLIFLYWFWDWCCESATECIAFLAFTEGLNI